MINLKQEIENCLKTLRNSNNKEQNFQGRLYAYFLKFEKEGYVVEMETNVKDDHITFFPKDLQYEKKEIDLLIYKKDYSEKYAVELKWIYHQNETGKWHYYDNLTDFEQDVLFVKQLKELAGFTATCSVVVVDTDKEKLTQLRSNRKNKVKEADFEVGYICGIRFAPRKKLYGTFEYFIVPF